MPIRSNQRINLVEEPRCSRHLPWQHRPPRLAAYGKGQSDRTGTPDLDAAWRNRPHRGVTLNFADAGLVALAICLRRNDVEPVVLVETSHPASATCTKASIAVEDKRHALGTTIRKLPEVHAAHAISVPAAD
ncbi:MAG: hypothetical protein ACI9ME_000442 [Ilumatobacter sp.]|jgi:hypothetical protein